MKKRAKPPFTQVEVIPATPAQKPILANLFELYAHDFSDFFDLDLGADGRFGYASLPLYWIEPDRHPFLIRVAGNLAGFVLVKKGSEATGNAATWDMVEFFVVRKYRRHGIGTQIAHDIWRRFPGSWEVRVMESNIAAYDFWVRAIAAFIGETIIPFHIEKDGQTWKLFSFESKPGL